MCFSSHQYQHRHYYYTSSELKSSPPPPHTNTHPVTLYNLFQLDFCVHIHKCLFPHTVSYNNCMWQCGAVYDRKAHCVRFVWRETYILFLHSVRCMEYVGMYVVSKFSELCNPLYPARACFNYCGGGGQQHLAGLDCRLWGWVISRSSARMYWSRLL